MTPTGQVHEFPLPDKESNVTGITAGPDGNLWFTDLSTLGRITPSGTISECAPPADMAFFLDITRGQDGHLWVTGNKQNGGFVGQVV